MTIQEILDTAESEGRLTRYMMQNLISQVILQGEEPLSAISYIENLSFMDKQMLESIEKDFDSYDTN